MLSFFLSRAAHRMTIEPYQSRTDVSSSMGWPDEAGSTGVLGCHGFMLFVPQPFYTSPKRFPTHYKLLCHVPERGRVPLLHNHGQVHSRMNGAIQVEGTS